jgi:hypothetical protein
VKRSGSCIQIHMRASFRNLYRPEHVRGRQSSVP